MMTVAKSESTSPAAEPKKVSEERITSDDLISFWSGECSAEMHARISTKLDDPNSAVSEWFNDMRKNAGTAIKMISSDEPDGNKK